MIEFKQNVELLIITNYFLNAAFVWFSSDAQTATIENRQHCAGGQWANNAVRIASKSTD
jgi:hypothetical protein